MDEEEYVTRNLRPASELPVFTGARPLTRIRDRCVSRKTRSPVASGFFTSRSFGLPRENESRPLDPVLRDTHARGWRAEEEFELRMLDLRRGEQYVRMLVVFPRQYVLSVDHRGDACPAP